jgi:hypothetical protein
VLQKIASASKKKKKEREGLRNSYIVESRAHKSQFPIDDFAGNGLATQYDAYISATSRLR